MSLCPVSLCNLRTSPCLECPHFPGLPLRPSLSKTLRTMSAKIQLHGTISTSRSINTSDSSTRTPATWNKLNEPTGKSWKSCESSTASWRQSRLTSTRCFSTSRDPVIRTPLPTHPPLIPACLNACPILINLKATERIFGDSLHKFMKK